MKFKSKFIIFVVKTKDIYIRTYITYTMKKNIQTALEADQIQWLKRDDVPVSLRLRKMVQKAMDEALNKQ
jgi:hypothetical protein